MNHYENTNKTEYGNYRYCVLVHKLISESLEIYLYADGYEIANGTISFFKKDLTLPTGMWFTLSLAPGYWSSVYAATRLDGTPLCGEYWPEQGVSNVEGVCETLIELRGGCDTPRTRAAKEAKERKKQETKTRNKNYRVTPRGLISPALRQSILERDNNRCVSCGKEPREGAKLELDHIIPVSKGGDNDPTNLRTLCWACNRGKGKRLPNEPLA